MSDISTEALAKILEMACPAMDDLKRISAEDYSIDLPGNGSWVWVGKSNNYPRIAIIERSLSQSGDERVDAIKDLCVIAPALAREVIALRSELAKGGAQ